MVFKILTVVGLLFAQIVTASFDLYAYGQTSDVAIAGQRVFYADGSLKLSCIDWYITYTI